MLENVRALEGRAEYGMAAAVGRCAEVARACALAVFLHLCCLLLLKGVVRFRLSVSLVTDEGEILRLLKKREPRG